VSVIHPSTIFLPSCRNSRPGKKERSLVIQLLIRDLLRLLLLPAQKRAQPAQRIRRNHQPRRNHRLSIRDNALTTNLLLLRAKDAEYVFLAVVPDLQRVEDDGFSFVEDLTGGLLDVGELGVEGRERAVAEGVGFLDVGGDVFVWFGEVGEEGLAEALVACVCDFEGLGAVGVRLEG
jgi:hypothetical protein